MLLNSNATHRSGTTASAVANVYTKGGQTLRVPLRRAPAGPGCAGHPEQQLMRWFNRRAAAEPGFPVRVRSILIISTTSGCAPCRQALLRFLGRYRLAEKLRLLVRPGSAGGCGCRRCRSAANVAAETTLLESWLGELAPEMAGESVVQEAVGPYRQVRGHHIHQSASYGVGGAARTNPNHRAAVAIAQGVPGFTHAQHHRAAALQRYLNQAYRGKNLRQQTGGVRVQGGGTGRLAPAANPWFEDQKAYYALRAAGKTPAEALRLVQLSARQLAAAGSRPVRVPSR
ncbi:hypothetical protein [Hymenobacter daecheongensis]|nr:hypothetical protein [Hymenobacter daecheongensis]